MGTHHVGPEYEINSGTLWYLIRDSTEDGRAWYMISKFKTSCGGCSSILTLINHYKGDYHNNKEHTLAYNMLKKSTHDKERAHQTFKMSANRQIAKYEVLKDNEEDIPQQKQIRDLQTKFTVPEMVVGKATITAEPGPTFPTLNTVVTSLNYFVSQKNNPGRGIPAAGHGSSCGCGGTFGLGGGGGRESGGVRGRNTVAAHKYTYPE